MSATRVAHKPRRGRTPKTGLAAIGAAAVTGAAAVLGSAVWGPPTAAGALDIEQEIYTAGPLLGLLPVLGIDTVTIPLGTLPVVGDANLTLNFNPVSDRPVDLYNTVNAFPFARRAFTATVYDRVLGPPADPTTQFPMVAASGVGARNLVDAYRAQISSVNGIALPGYTPFQPGAGPDVNTTNQVLVFLRNPLRPNGGLDARFAPIVNLFGVDTTVPAAGVTTSSGITLNAATLDVTWAYDLFSDFPVTLNPFSLANSVFAALLTDLLGGVELKGIEDTTALGLNVASVLGIVNRIAGGLAGVDDGLAWYGTLLPNDLPILEPLRLPSRILNAAFGLDLGTPLADALQPALTILVNTGYSDVVTPADIAADPALADKYQPYDRTFLTSGVPETFLSVAPLTPAEWLQVPGDVLTALITGFRDVFVPAAPATPPVGVAIPSASTDLGDAVVSVPAGQSPVDAAVTVRRDRSPAPIADAITVDVPAVEMASRETRGPSIGTVPSARADMELPQADAALPQANAALPEADAGSPRADARPGAQVGPRSQRQGSDAPAPRRSAARSAANR